MSSQETINNGIKNRYLKVSSKIKNRFNNTKLYFENALNNTEDLSEMLIYFICIVIITLILWWIYNIYTLNNSNCNYMDSLYTKRPILNSIKYSNQNKITNDFSFKLFDYYIKTAYNCCSAGKYKNDFVNLCALKNCIKQGARCLDMQIYSLNNNPVVATSSIPSYNTKETYNSLPLSVVLSTIYDYAFSRLYCSNHEDPLIIHFRIMSKNIKMYNEMSKLLKLKLKDKILGPKYSYENYYKNIGKEKLLDFINKIIIVVDNTNPIFIDTKLNEYVNLTSNSAFMRLVRYTNDIKLAPDMNELIEYNKTYMTMCMPDLNKNFENPNFNIAKEFGCQMIGMAFQNNDSNLQYYNSVFNDNNYAFILKPEPLRYIFTTVKVSGPDAEEYLSNPVKKQVGNDITGEITLET